MRTIKNVNRQTVLSLLLLWVPVGLNADIAYNVSLDTSSLLSTSAGPFSLSFQLSDGSGTGDGNNAAILSDFAFGAGSALGSPLLFGSALGDLSIGLTLTDSSGVAFFGQKFTPGTSLSFKLSLTTNLDVGPIPDAFTISILDSSLTPIPTSAGAPFDMLAEIDIDSATPAVATFSGDTSRTPAVGGGPIAIAAPLIASSVPEPRNGLFVAIAFLVGLALRSRGRLEGAYRRQNR
jgi:hypothetical protein